MSLNKPQQAAIRHTELQWTAISHNAWEGVTISQNKDQWATKYYNKPKGSKINHNKAQWATISHIELPKWWAEMDYYEAKKKIFCQTKSSQTTMSLN